MNTSAAAIVPGISMNSILLGVVSQHWGFGVMWPLVAVCTLLGLAGLLAADRCRWIFTAK